MKYAQKMVLIPEAEYLSLLKKEPSTQNQFRQGMNEILQGNRDHTAATQMSQLVGTYLRQKESERPVKQKVSDKKEDLSVYFEPIYHRKLSLLLSQLRNQGFRWNEDNELILPSGQVIQNSNIVDLLTEAIVAKRKKAEREATPLGWESFIQSIASSSIPKSLFTKKSTVEDIDKVQHGSGKWEVY